MTSFIQLFAEAGGGGTGGGSGFPSMLMLIAMMGIFYFLLIRPQRQQAKKAEEMRSNLSKNDEVVTLGGIHGKIVGLTEKTVTLNVANNNADVHIKFDRSAIGHVISETKASEDSE